jgi:hypothetical protein
MTFCRLAEDTAAWALARYGAPTTKRHSFSLRSSSCLLSFSTYCGLGHRHQHRLLDVLQLVVLLLLGLLLLRLQGLLGLLVDGLLGLGLLLLGLLDERV